MYTGDYTAAVRQFNEFLDEGQGWIENNINACKDLAQCYARLGEDISALQSLLRSFCYDVPRAELCCDIGKYFLTGSNTRQPFSGTKRRQAARRMSITAASACRTATDTFHTCSYVSATTGWATAKEPHNTMKRRGLSSRTTKLPLQPCLLSG